jgi:hypothetical protein
LSAGLGLTKTSVHRILTDELKLYPYKIQVMQVLSDNDKVRRLRFAKWGAVFFEDHPLVLKRLWFTDEAHVDLTGYVNKQNMRFWATQNPHIIHESPLHPQRVTVWCAISSQGLIGPFFIAGSVTGETYRNLVQRQFLPELERLGFPVGRQWFMQDGATPHTANDTLDVLFSNFKQRVLSNRYSQRHNVGHDWPPHSPDLNPCDFFLWGFLKDKIFQQRVTSLDMLQERIRTVLTEVDISVCKRVVQNFTLRFRSVIKLKGGHMEHIVRM